MKQNGVFNKIKGLWIGNYEHESGISLEKIIMDVLDSEYKFPIIKSNNFGHIERKTVIPKAIFISFPALPTKGSPSLSSSAPGPSPINIISAFLLPTPNTIFCLVLHNLHLLQLIIDFSSSSHVSNIFTPFASILSKKNRPH